MLPIYPKDTLAHYLQRPLAVHRDVRDVPVAQFVKYTRDYMNAPGFSMANPDQEAIRFYVLNHIASVIRQKYDLHEPMPAHVAALYAKYDEVASDQALRALHYLLLITTREARHNKSLSSAVKHMQAHHGPEIASFFQVAGGEDSIHKRLLSSPPKAPIGTYVDAVRWQFYHSSWASSYGGPKWGNVTDCLHGFVHGVLSAEMMLDTNWTLAHNGGPIFNKGYLYGSYSHDLYRILDLQRAGMLPTAVVHDKAVRAKTPVDMRNLLTDACVSFPELVQEEVDWKGVVALGAHGLYKEEIAAQKTSSVGFAELKNKAVSFSTKPTVGTKIEAAGYYHITTGMKIKKIEKVRKVDG